ERAQLAIYVGIEKTTIILLAVGGAVAFVVVIICAVGIYFYRKKRKKQREEANKFRTPEDPEGMAELKLPEVAVEMPDETEKTQKGKKKKATDAKAEVSKKSEKQKKEAENVAKKEAEVTKPADSTTRNELENVKHDGAIELDENNRVIIKHPAAPPSKQEKPAVEKVENKVSKKEETNKGKPALESKKDESKNPNQNTERKSKTDKEPPKETKKNEENAAPKVWNAQTWTPDPTEAEQGRVVQGEVKNADRKWTDVTQKSRGSISYPSMN
uniref:Uncharacterized protein n=1 Tax=Panagrolaimus sp. JU765 TaxID=591449 RepID=A0AC34PVC2_9BILA